MEIKVVVVDDVVDDEVVVEDVEVVDEIEFSEIVSIGSTDTKLISF